MPENSSCSSAGSCTKSSCEGCPSHNGGPQSFLVEQNKFSNIKHVIGVVSGKGGVGINCMTNETNKLWYVYYSGDTLLENQAY